MQQLLAILVCVVLNSVAQIFLKFGMSNLHQKLSLSIGAIYGLITNVYVVIGGTLYGASFILWLYVLSKVRVSYAYPFISLSYVLVVILGFFLLGERIFKSDLTALLTSFFSARPLPVKANFT